ncbi:cellulose binding domain-containing protein [Actinocorallia herbida]|uniref:Cellulose binding domain-containing protein n=1 Tax=Actinocorallia herbida TaxID=58109 RepID=A0A3N1CPU4_9ACTN|nr:cellulose binding domain-containing protein [Actinocorallia herbida]ROO83322.1 cellulose binding domain-containing protein [Actinocorallia herbida]
MGGKKDRATRRDLPLPGRRARARARRETAQDAVAPEEDVEATIADRAPETAGTAETPWGTPVPRAERTVVESASAAAAREDDERTVVDARFGEVRPDDAGQTIVDMAARKRDVPVAGRSGEGGPADARTVVDAQGTVPKARVSEETVVDRRAPAEAEAPGEGVGQALPGLPPRPQPDVMFGPVVGADDATGPQPPLPVLMGLLGRPPAQGDPHGETLRTHADRRVHPPISPVLAEALYTPPRPKRKIGLVIPGVIATGLLVIGAVAALIWPETAQGPRRTPASGLAPTVAAPADQTAQGVSGVTPDGVRVVYKTVEVSTGYFEGTLTLTNDSKDTIPSWTVAFTYPGAFIRNVWGGELTDPGNEVTIISDDATSPIAPGESVEIRFGGGGTPSRPQGCTFGGTPCGF